MNKLLLPFIILHIFFVTSGQEKKLPIIDMHLHAFSTSEMTKLFNLKDYKLSQAEYQAMTMAELAKYNIIAVASGQHEVVREWRFSNPDRIKPGLLLMHPDEINVDSLRKWHRQRTLDVIGEITVQYWGLNPDDPRMEPIWQLAEELDIPLAIHMGTGPRNAAYRNNPEYRASKGRPLLLEDILVKHPKVRVQIMHAGWPFLDEMLALLYYHPQVYVDLGVINKNVPPNNFYQYLKGIVDAGFADRIMFGSDQMLWPENIGPAIEIIEKADFISSQQKRDIFYNNAARFLRLSKEEIAKHHGK